MHDPRHEEPLTDASLDRAIEQALAVEPSPAFQARVRSRVAPETLSRTRYGWWVGLGACATPVLLLALYLTLPGQTGTPELMQPERVADVAPRPASDLTESTSAAPPPGTPLSPSAADRMPRQVAQNAQGEGRREQAGAAHRRIVMVDVVIAAAEVRAVRALMEHRLLEPEGRLEGMTGSDANVSEAASFGADLLADVDIAPIEIEPLELAVRVPLQGE